MWNCYSIGNVKEEWLKISLQPFLTSGSPIREPNKAIFEHSVKSSLNLRFCCFSSRFTEQYINQSWKPCQDSRRYIRILHCKWCQRSKKVINIFLIFKFEQRVVNFFWFWFLFLLLVGWLFFFMPCLSFIRIHLKILRGTKLVL